MFLVFLSFVHCLKEGQWFKLCIYPTTSTSPAADCNDFLSQQDPQFLNSLKNIIKAKPDVEIYLAESEQSIPFDLNLFGKFGKNIKLSGQFSGSIFKFLYLNSNDYTNLNLQVEKIAVSFQNDDPEVRESELKIGGLNLTNAKSISFIKGSKTVSTKLVADSISINADQLTNITDAQISDKGNMTIGAQSCTIDADIEGQKMVLNIHTPTTNSLTISYSSTTHFNFDYSSTSHDSSSLGIRIKYVATQSLLPQFNILNVDKFELSGAFPQTTKGFTCFNLEHYSEAFTNVEVIIHTAYAPININVPYLYCTVDQSTSFTGNIKAFKSNVADFNLFFMTSATQDIDLKFQGNVTGRISALSCYMKFTIDNLVIPFSYGGKQPFTVAFDQDHITTYNIKELVDNSESKFEKFKLYSVLATQLSDADLQSKGFANGKPFLIVPANSLQIASEIQVSYDDSMPDVSKTIHGFNNDANCLSIVQTTSSNILTVLIQGKTIKNLQRRICFTTSSGCSGYPAVATAESQLNNLVGNNLLPAGIDDFSITFQSDMTAALDLSNLDASLTNSSITLDCGSRKVEVTLNQNSQQNIFSLTFKNDKLSNTYNFLMKEVRFIECKLAQQNIQFGADTESYFDLESLKTMSTTGTIPKLNLIIDSTTELTISQSNFSIKEYISDTAYPTANIGSLKFVGSSQYNCIITIQAIVDQGTAFKTFQIETFTESIIKLYGNWPDVTYAQGNPSITHHNPLSLIYTLPHQGEKFNITGEGKVAQTIDYGKEYTFCIYKIKNDDCSTFFDDAVVTLDAFEEKYKTVTTNEGKRNIVIKLTSEFSSLEAACPLKLDMFDISQVQINSALSSSKAYVNLTYDKGISDPVYTTTYLKGLNVNVVKNGNNLSFGNLRIDGCTFTDSIKNQITLVAKDLQCEYKDLSLFYNISIKDNCILSGTEFPTDSVNIYFELDDNANDLQAELTKDTQMFIGDGRVILGTIRFNIPRSNYFDALFSFPSSFNSEAKLSIKLESHSSLPLMPKVTINGSNLQYKTFEVEMTDQWQNIYNVELFQITDCKQVNLKIADIVPLKLVNTEHINITLSGMDCGVTGPIEMKPGPSGTIIIAQPLICINAPSDENIYNFTIMNGINITVPFDIDGQKVLWMAGSNIKVKIPTIDTTSLTKMSYFPYVVTLDMNGISQLIIDEVKGQYLSLNQTVIIDCLIPKQFDETKVKLFTQMSYILTPPKTHIQYLDLKLEYNPKGIQTHGFTQATNVLTVFCSDGTPPYGTGCLLIPARAPSDVPFTVFYDSKKFNETAEISLTDENVTQFNDLSTLLPIVIHDLVITFENSLSESHPVNLPSIKTVSKVEFISNNIDIPTIVITPPSDTSMSLTFDKIKVQSTQKTLKANVLNMTDCNFVENTMSITTDNVKSMNLDADSFTQLLNDGILSKTTPFNNPVTVRSSNVVNFSSDGWAVSENGFQTQVFVSASIIPSITFESYEAVQLIVKDGVTSIKAAKMIIHQNKDKVVKVALGKNWANVVNTDKLQIDLSSTYNNVEITSPFYPIPDLFRGDEFSYKYIAGYAEEEEKETPDIDVKIPAGYRYNESRQFDFDERIPEDKRKVTAPDVIFCGRSPSVNFANNNGTLYLAKGVVEKETNAQISKAELSSQLIMNRDASVTGTFTFGPSSELQFNWLGADMPNLKMFKDITTVPGSIKIHYDSNTYNRDEFNVNVYNNPMRIITGKFQCNDYKNKVKFESSIDYFSSTSDKNVFEVKCEEQSTESALVVTATKKIPNVSPSPIIPSATSGGDSGDSTSKAGLGAGEVVGVVFGILLVGGVIIGVVVYMVTRNKYQKLLNSNNLETSDTERYDSIPKADHL